MARVSIEDCLINIENKFVLVAVASHRARKLLSGNEATISSRNKEAVTALREIAEGKILVKERPAPPVVAPTSEPVPTPQ